MRGEKKRRSRDRSTFDLSFEERSQVLLGCLDHSSAHTTNILLIFLHDNMTYCCI